MVSIGRTVSLGLFVLTLGLALSFPAESHEPKAGNPVAHRTDDAVETNKQAPSNQKAAQPPAAPEKPSGEAAPANDTSANKGSAKHDGEGPKWTDMAQAFSAIIVMGFTGFLAWLSWRQHVLESKLAAETSDSIEIARQSAGAAQESATALSKSVDLTIANLRAYVSAVSANFVPAADGKGPGAQVHFRNTGQTPARDVVIVARIDYIRAPFDNPLGELDPPVLPSKQILLSSDTSMTVPFCSRDLLPVEMDALKSGGAALVTWGRIDYQDFIGRPQWSTFAFFVGGHYGFTGGGTYALWHEGNVST